MHARLKKIIICTFIFHWNTFFHWDILTFHWNTFTFIESCACKVAQSWFCLLEDYNLHFYILLKHFYFSLNFFYFSLNFFYISLKHFDCSLKHFYLSLRYKFFIERSKDFCFLSKLMPAYSGFYFMQDYNLYKMCKCNWL